MLLRVWRRLVHSALRIMTKWALGLYYRVTVIGAENIPANGPLIVVANHPAAIDSYCLPAFLKKNLIFFSKSEYFELPGIKGWLLRKLLTNRTISVQRDSPIDAARALKKGTQVLSEGGDVGTHPEATRSPPGVVCKGRTGAVQMAWDTGAFILPVGIMGTYRARFRSHITLVVGEPMHFAKPRLLGNIPKARARALEEQTRAMQKKIAGLAGLPYVDEYVADFKKKLAADLLKKDE